MSTQIKTFIDEQGNQILPRTTAAAVYMNDGATTIEKALETAGVQSDWSQTDSNKKDYIKNKPSNLARVIDLTITKDNWNYDSYQEAWNKTMTVSGLTANNDVILIVKEAYFTPEYFQTGYCSSNTLDIQVETQPVEDIVCKAIISEGTGKINFLIERLAQQEIDLSTCVSAPMSAIIPKGRMKGDVNRVGEFSGASTVNSVAKGTVPAPTDPVNFWAMDINNDSVITDEDYSLIRSLQHNNLALSEYVDYYNNWHIVPNEKTPSKASYYWETYIDYPGLSENNTIYILVQGEYDYNYFKDYQVFNDFENARIIIRTYKIIPLVDLPCFIFIDSQGIGENLLIPQKIKYMNGMVQQETDKYMYTSQILSDWYPIETEITSPGTWIKIIYSPVTQKYFAVSTTKIYSRESSTSTVEWELIYTGTYIKDIAISDDGETIVAIRGRGTGGTTTYSSCYASFDGGVSFSEVAMGISARWSSVTYGDNKFVAVSGLTSGTTTSSIAAYSPDGRNWTQTKLSAAGKWAAVDYSLDFSSNEDINGYFVAITPTGVTSRSFDGITWTAGDTIADANNLIALAHIAGGYFVATEDADASEECTYFTMDGGMTWEMSSSGPSRALYSAILGMPINGEHDYIGDDFQYENAFIGVSGQEGIGTVYVSYDGNDWDIVRGGAPLDHYITYDELTVQSIAAGEDGVWVIPTEGEIFYFSPWSKEIEENFEAFSDIEDDFYSTCLIEVGEYIGSGSKGPDDPKHLYCDFVPEIVFITGPIAIDVVGTVVLSPYSHSAQIMTGTNSKATSQQLHVSYFKGDFDQWATPDVEGLEWFSYAGGSLAQLDALDAIYHYVAIGKKHI